jgi:hypothetical protein
VCFQDLAEVYKNNTILTYPIVIAEQPRTNMYSLMIDTCYPKHVGDMTTIH